MLHRTRNAALQTHAFNFAAATAIILLKQRGTTAHSARKIPRLATRRFNMASYNVKSHSDFAGYDVPAENGAIGGVRRVLRNVSAWSQERRAYNQAAFELSGLSDRDLADIGIARCDIPSIAREAAQAKKVGC
jgi:uncharacterized protein YjiS (DUF1127 family)